MICGIYICSEQDTMEIFFQDHHSFESAMWRGLMAVLVGLGAMAFLASLTR